MMAAPRDAYRAIRVIEHNGARAYNPGDSVHESAVIGSEGAGPGAWLVIGDDVEAAGDLEIKAPALNASQGAWAAYAVSRGIDRDEAAGMSRAQLIEATAEA